MTRISPLKLSLAAIGLLLVAPPAAAPQEASADVRVRIGGSAHVRIGGRGHYRAPRVRVVRPWWRPHRVNRPVIHVGGHIWLGGGYYYERPFAQPPPPPAACDCGPQYYGPIAPAPATYAAAVVIEEPKLPRWGIGAFLGGVSVDGEHEGKDTGLVGQFRLTRGLLLEGEIAENTLQDGGRVDRRMLIGLNWELGAHRKMAPYLTAGIGTSQVELDGGWEDNQAVAEIGAGLRWRIADHISLFGDMRFGSRESIEQDSPEDRPVIPPTDAAGRSLIPDREENYSRVRLGAMVTF